ncbi:MAG: glutamate decarboxylase, partial [Culicoidibacterales bacterium]
MAILHSNKKNDQHNFTNKENYDTPLFGTKEMDLTLPKKTLAQASISPQVAYRLIADELMDEGNARLNLATFCQTFMEPEAIQLMTESLEKNAIDKSEYPQTTELENRCVSIIADLWHV